VSKIHGGVYTSSDSVPSGCTANRRELNGGSIAGSGIHHHHRSGEGDECVAERGRCADGMLELRSAHALAGVDATTDDRDAGYLTPVHLVRVGTDGVEPGAFACLVAVGGLAHLGGHAGIGEGLRPAVT